ncbi:CBS domain-containing protein [Streptomyces sp. SID10115]|nr:MULTISPECIES: CBS domain-containing protein [unclassified Streptomyces]NDZ88067.1 CBS domain-containing protein [Streptomyces sp. SID10115]NDZ98229.1 CBS domain-containing protein [Streptomyces sp. SID10116]NEB47587.1 CBS domain-containing protein [Streptomyces sp. SID339]
MRTRAVGEVMTDEVVQARPGTSFKELTALLTTHRISGLPVVDEDDKVMGVVSQTDLARHQANRPDRSRPASPGTPTARTLMTSPAVTVHPEQRVVEAARIMERRHVARLPVVDEEDRLIGIATRRDLLRVFLRTDEEIRTDVAAEISARVPSSTRDDIRLRVRDGVVHLECPAHGDFDTTVLLRAAWRVDGVVGVMRATDA